MHHRELNPQIQLPASAHLRLSAMATACETALQARRFADQQIMTLKRDVLLYAPTETDPEKMTKKEKLEFDEHQRFKANLASTQARREIDEANHKRLTERLRKIYKWADNVIIDCIRKHRVVPPFVAAEVDENSSDPAAWLGVKAGKAEPIKSRRQLRVEHARDPAQRPGEHPLSFAKRMERMNGSTRQRMPAVPPQEFCRSVVETTERNLAAWAKRA